MEAADVRGGRAAWAGSNWRPIPLADTVIDDAFWSPRLKVNRERTIPFEYAQCKQTGRIDALRHTWRPGMQPVPHIFWDSDVAKWIEAASYSLATHFDAALDALVDETIALLAGAQLPDGYLNTYFTVVKPGKRWTDLRDAHELYCAGHLIEAGVAHFQATGKRSLLDVVCRYADHIDSVFGTKPGQIRGYCGHEEIELALVRLYRATGERRYLNLAAYFVDERGRQPNYFESEAAERGTPGYFEIYRGRGQLRTSWEYNQSHLPVREQTEVVGHAVRAMYLCSAMTDLAAETGDESLRAACRRLWDHLCSKRLYITGGIGSATENEGFTTDYDLPNETAYTETCAAIGLVLWSHRMLQLERDGRYADVLEQALYNRVLSGVSLDGTSFFYENPLASSGGVQRKEWFGVSCCPPNLARLLGSLGQYVYSSDDSGIAVHLYVQSHTQTTVSGHRISLRLRTDYPWDGVVRLAVAPDAPTTFTLSLRMPGWCRAATLRINGKVVDPAGIVVQGYARLTRRWVDGDTVELDLAMPVERIYAHPEVAADAGRVALQRGPLVYCLEDTDNPVAMHRVVLPSDALFTAQKEGALLGGIVTLRCEGSLLDESGWDGVLYRTEPPAHAPQALTAIPYNVWGNRGAGAMQVWLRE